MDDKVYLVITEDRHTDVQIEVWADKELALQRARKIATDMLSSWLGKLEIEDVPTWLYYARYSTEGDCVHVEEADIRRE